MHKAILAAVAIASAFANDSSCGPDSPSSVKDCSKVDHGSCGNACCTVDVKLGATENITSHTYETIVGYLKSGGEDGSYAYVTGADAAGNDPSDDLTPYGIPWSYIFQGTHTTTGGYVDTLNFNIAKVDASGSATLRIFSISNIHGALGDNGQNFKNIAYLIEGRSTEIVYGCGAQGIPTRSES